MTQKERILVARRQLEVAQVYLGAIENLEITNPQVKEALEELRTLAGSLETSLKECTDEH